MSAEKQSDRISSVLSTSLSAAVYLSILQLFARVLTFAMNQLVLRYITPAVFGLASIQMELLAGTILFFSREAFRSALLRASLGIEPEETKLVNLSYIPVGLGVLISILVGLYFIYINPSGDVRFYVPCVIICTIGTFIEILVEPVYIIAQNRLYLRLRNILSRNVVTYYFDPKLLNLAKTFMKQSIMKQFLTEGDKIILSFTTTAYEQGVYAFVVNYGLLFICFGTNYTSLLIDLLTGPSWSHHTQAPLTLAIYCLYVPIMGVNGITEAFVQSVATENDLQSQSLAMAFFSLLFGISGIILLKWLKVGAVGLVLANMINLSGRIGWSWQFIGRYFTEKWSILEKRRGQSEHVGIEMGKIIPNSNVLTTFVLSWAATKYSEQVIGWESMEQKVKHIGVGIGCLLLCSLVL
ncbi:Rft protein-domain-containing protein, partial [Paraphysoderma sedebokerense]